MLADDAAGPALGLNIFNVEPSDEPLNGKPRSAHVQKTEYSLGQPVVSLVAVTDYDTAGRIIDQRVFRPGGTLSFHQAFQYEADQYEYDPRVDTIQTLDAQGAIVRTRKVLNHPQGEESTVFLASGEICEKTRTRRDAEGRIMEAVSEDTLRDQAIRMKVDYRDGRTETHVTFTEPPRRDINIVGGPDGTTVSYRDSAGHAHEFRQTRHTVVQSRDAEGNWTRKTTVERDPATGDEIVIASMERLIAYYAD